MAINWALGLLPDYGDTFMQSFEQGRQTGKAHALERAYQTYASDPGAGASAAMAIDPAAGMALQRDYQAQQDRTAGQQTASALASGDRESALLAASKLGPDQVMAVHASIAKLDDHQRALVQRRNEQLGSILLGARHATADVNERLAIAQHVASLHPEFGIKPEQITLQDMSDAGIDTHLAAVRTLDDVIAQHKPVAVAPGGSLVDPANPTTPLYTAPDRVPAGFMRDGQGNLVPITGGPADPTYIGTVASKRHVTGGGGRGHGGGAPASGVPAGFVLD